MPRTPQKTKSFTRISAATTRDPIIDEFNRTARRAVAEIQNRRTVQAEIIEGIELPNNTDVFVSHGMGRPVVCLISPPRDKYDYPTTSGSVVEVRGTVNPDPTKFVVLNATSWTDTVYVDIVLL